MYVNFEKNSIELVVNLDMTCEFVCICFEYALEFHVKCRIQSVLPVNIIILNAKT